MSNTLLAIIGALVSMLTMVGFSVVQLEKLSSDDPARDDEPARDPQTV